MVAFLLDGEPLCPADGNPSDCASECGALCSGSVLVAEASERPYVQKLKDGASFRAMPDWVRDHEDCAMAAAKRRPASFEHASRRLRGTLSFVMDVLKIQCSAIAHASEEVCRSDDVLSFMAKEWATDAFASSHPELAADRTLMLRAVGIEGIWLKSVSQELRGDREVVLTAVRNNRLCGSLLSRASPELRMDASFVTQCVEWSTMEMNGAHPRLLDDLEFGLSAVRTHASWLPHLSRRLRDTEDVICASARTLDYFRFASDRLRSDIALVRRCIAAHPNGYDVLRYTTPSVQDDRDTVMEALPHASPCLRWASPRLRNDPEVVMLAMRMCPHTGTAIHSDALEYAGEELRGNPAFLMRCVQVAPTSLRHASDRLRQDPELVWAAVSRDYRAFQFAHRSLRGNADFVTRCVALYGGCFEHAHRRLRNSRKLGLLALKTDGRMLQYCNSSICGSKAAVLTALRTSSPSWRHTVFQYASPEVRSDRYTVAMAVWRSPSQFAYADAHWDDVCMVAFAALLGGRELVLRHAPEVCDARLVVCAGYAHEAAPLLALGCVVLAFGCAIYLLMSCVILPLAVMCGIL
eukprot:TRINITY_DN50353_c0_g1_i1.p1 TRINITY_DN50353_c0_g1~~TRINITY_DN50353_c0_g1_i1.p1  ORF type:complete len:621 (+),score=142.88 TRINITY_DN50353_c0_g1_i1:126-1865(+)